MMVRKRATGQKPDLVDRAGIAERLGVSAPTVSRWHRRSILPEPDMRLGATELWNWNTIGEWAKDRSRFAKHRTRSETPALVELPGVAEQLGVEIQIVENWHRNGLLPAPDYRWETVDAWLGETITAWSRARLSGRMTGGAEFEVRPIEAREAHPSGPRLTVPGLTPRSPATADPRPSNPPSTTPDPTPQTPAAAATADPLPSSPNGDRLSVPGISPESPAVIDHRDGTVPVRAVASPSGAVAVTPVGEQLSDPIGDLERIGDYFSELADSIRES